MNDVASSQEVSSFKDEMMSPLEYDAASMCESTSPTVKRSNVPSRKARYVRDDKYYYFYHWSTRLLHQESRNGISVGFLQRLFVTRNCIPPPGWFQCRHFCLHCHNALLLCLQRPFSSLIRFFDWILNHHVDWLDTTF
jgi:hypothetical protein